jgi:hypothetical protein
MNLLINCQLTAPPSEVGAFRTVTLYATVFKKYDCLIVAEKDQIDYYYHWIKRHGAHDFVKQFVIPNSETGIELNVKRLTFNNLHNVIYFLS